ncbi:PilZ domain-containing protein [Thalassotalea mangrovi]|uniref:Pilus assembly protein PilZ n=1 Tax=Thalassotalea mangrovi TaxID=2572245 RepID=A0A4U1B602_9GAMM|nr:PilZ domain-containing protein [Thalassotalea mangrovi]TKB45893.1 pilus assembly protein PilZ [Thalassotalea mangrovi]
MTEITLQFANEKELYLSYMPFLKQGGLFIKTEQAFELGDEISLQVLLPGQEEHVTLTTQVCWITPHGAHNGTETGVGVAFLNDEFNVRNQIESSLGRMLNSKEPTYTM